MAAAGAMAVSSAIASTRPVALVTGSTDGIGRLTAQLLSSDYKVLLHGRAQSRPEETRDGIMAENKDAEIEMYCMT